MACLNDPAVVAREYASPDRLAARARVYSGGHGGGDALQVAFDAVTAAASSASEDQVHRLADTLRDPQVWSYWRSRTTIQAATRCSHHTEATRIPRRQAPSI